VAIKALASFSRPEDLPLLRELAKDKDREVRTAAIEALASFSGPEVLVVLRELALAPYDEIAVTAICGLASRCSREEIEMFLNQYDQKLCAGALAAFDELLYMPEWLKAGNR
jgi:HEAT repeat protein